jgi:F0F1-type ATP synthase membrane subunit b/b'
MLVWQLALIQIITFVVIILFLRMLFYRQVQTALRRLQELNSKNLEKEVALNKELERAKGERQLEIEKGKEEARKIRDAAREEVGVEKEQIILEAKRQAEQILKQASLECERLKREAVSQIEESSVTLASGLIREIFSEKSKQALQKELVDELIEELRKTEKEKIKVDFKTAEITSSSPLLDSQKYNLRDILQTVVGHHVDLEEKTDTAIISGLIINLGGLVLDGSLQNKLRKIIPYLREQKPGDGSP